MPTDKKGVGVVYLTLTRDPRNAYKVTVVKANAKMPRALPPECVVVKVRLQVGLDIFAPLEASNILNVSVNQVRRAEQIVVEAS